MSGLGEGLSALAGNRATDGLKIFRDGRQI